MKRLKIMIMILTVILSLSCLKGNSQAEQVEVSVKVGDHFPAAHLIPKALTKPWMTRVEALTNGAIKFQHFPSQQLVKQKEALPALQRKIVDIALVNPGLFPSELPLSGVVFLPSGYDSVPHGGRAIQKLFESKVVFDEYIRAGIRPLLIVPMDAYEILTSKRQVRTPDDAKGLKLRAGGEGQVWATRELGATPVTLGAPEMYTAIQRGTIDGALFPYGAVGSYRLAEVCKYGTVGANVVYAVVIYCVSEDFWNKLDQVTQNAMLQAASEIMPTAWSALEKEREAVIEESRSIGMVLTEIGDDIQTAWGEKLGPVRDKWVTNMEAKGLSGQQALKAWDIAVKQTR